MRRGGVICLGEGEVRDTVRARIEIQRAWSMHTRHRISRRAWYQKWKRWVSSHLLNIQFLAYDPTSSLPNGRFRIFSCFYEHNFPTSILPNLPIRQLQGTQWFLGWKGQEKMQMLTLIHYIMTIWVNLLPEKSVSSASECCQSEDCMESKSLFSIIFTKL